MEQLDDATIADLDKLIERVAPLSTSVAVNA
jgi:hypothetical protein